jgi:hypothetical protein
MALRDDRTFFLEGTIPSPEREGFTCTLHTPVDAPTSGFPMHRSSVRLLGASPLLTVQPVEAVRGTISPGFHAFVIEAQDMAPAAAREARFLVGSGVVSALRAGDVVRMVYSHNADLGLAVFRRGKLQAAMGALTALRLGPEIVVTLPWDLVERAEDIFVERDPDFLGSILPKRNANRRVLCATPIPCPYEMRYGDVSKLVTHVTRQLGPFDVGQVQGAVRGFETTGAKGFIVRRGAMDSAAARETAAMLARGPKVTGYRPFDGPPPQPDKARE